MVDLHLSSDNSEGASCRILLSAGDTGHTVETEERGVAYSSRFPLGNVVSPVAHLGADLENV
jgi:hypothetical protein